MTLAQYGIYSLLGICVVFSGLALLMLIIKLFSLIPGLGDDDSKKAAGGTAATQVEEPSQPAPCPPTLAPGSAGDLKLYDTDPRDAAMVMAIVANELGVPLNELRFLSIKEVKR